MTVLPTNEIDLSAGIALEQQPSLTWNIDTDTDRIRGTADDWGAVKQAVDIILHVERFRWQIFTPYSGIQWVDLIGLDPGYVVSELQRRIRAALMVDDRIRGISDFSYTIDNDVLTVSLTVDTVFGSVPTSVEVKIS